MSLRNKMVFGSVAVLSSAALMVVPLTSAQAADTDASVSAFGNLDLSQLPVVTGDFSTSAVASGLIPTTPPVTVSLLNDLTGNPVANTATISLLGLKATIGSDRLLHLTSPLLGISAATPLDSTLIAANPALAFLLGVQLSTASNGQVTGTAANGSIVLLPGRTTTPTTSPTVAPTQSPSPSVSVGVTLFPTAPVTSAPTSSPSVSIGVTLFPTTPAVPTTVPTGAPTTPVPTTTPAPVPTKINIPAPTDTATEDPADPSTLPLTGSTMRIAGDDRYSTAVASAMQSHNNPEYVVLASGENGHLVDALAASPLAAALNAPILTVQQGVMPTSTWNYLQGLTNLRGVVVIGAQASISDEVMTKAGSLASQGAMRIGGSDRYATSALIASKFNSASHVYVASGSNGHLVDAVAVAGIAAATDSPILLAPNDGGTPADVKTQITRLAPASIDVLGGPNAVSTQVQTELQATRIAGGNRYETAVLSAQAANLQSANERVVLASGMDAHLVDALATSGFQVTTVLTAPGETTDITRDYLGSVDPAEIILAGGADLVAVPSNN